MRLQKRQKVWNILGLGLLTIKALRPEIRVRTPIYFINVLYELLKDFDLHVLQHLEFVLRKLAVCNKGVDEIDSSKGGERTVTEF